VRGGLDDGAVPGEVGLGGQHVHGLCPGDAGHGVQRQGRDAAGAQGLHELRLASRIEPGDEGRTVAQLVEALGLGGVDTQDQLAAPDLRVVGEPSAGPLVGRVEEARCTSGAALDEHVVAEAHEFLDGLRGGGDQCLVRALAWDSKTHDDSSSHGTAEAVPPPASGRRWALGKP
jgi:hypothetical protein